MICCENVVDITMSFFGNFLFVSAEGNYRFFILFIYLFILLWSVWLETTLTFLFLQIERTRGVRL